MTIWNRRDALQVRNAIERMGLCGCGTNDHWIVIFELLERAEDHAKHGSFCQENFPWMEFGAKVLDSWRLLEHGSSISAAWLSRDGELLLRLLRDFGTETHPTWLDDFGWDETEDQSDSFGIWDSDQLK